MTAKGTKLTAKDDHERRESEYERHEMSAKGAEDEQEKREFATKVAKDAN